MALERRYLEVHYRVSLAYFCSILIGFLHHITQKSFNLNLNNGKTREALFSNVHDSTGSEH